jgi:hypothetical protein
MRIGGVWGSVRGIVRDSFSFAQIKDLVGAAGLPIHTLGHLRQGSGSSGYTSKGQLMDAIDALVTDLEPDPRDRYVAACITEIARRGAKLIPILEDVLLRVGWGLIGDQPYPLYLRIDLDTADFGEQIRTAIANCLRRYRDGDISGAMTSICGVIESLTDSQYTTHSLGNHRNDSYQERVSKSFAALESAYRAPLDRSSLSTQEKDRLWHNHKQSINQTAYVLASFRREFSDAHGPNDAPPEILQRAIDCAVFILRSITTLTSP